MTKISTSIAASLLCLPLVTPVFAQAPVPVPSAPTPVSQPAPVYAPSPVQGPFQAPTPVVVQQIVQQAPATLTIPLGTYITVETINRLSTDRSHPDDAFTAILHQPIVVDGWVVARAGQPVIGRVVSVQKSGRIQGKSDIGIELGELVLVDGQQIPIRTQMIQNEANSTTNRDLGAVIATTAIGALIGGGADGGSGAAIGAGIGAGAGVAGVLATPGDSTKIYPERVLAFRLDNPVTISTERSSHAFLAVTAADYSNSPAPRLRVAAPVSYAAPATSVILVPDGYPRRYRRY